MGGHGDDGLMRLPVRLDRHLDVFAVDVAGVMAVTSQAETHKIDSESASLYTCWPQPHQAQGRCLSACSAVTPAAEPTGVCTWRV